MHLYYLRITTRQPSLKVRIVKKSFGTKLSRMFILGDDAMQFSKFNTTKNLLILWVLPVAAFAVLPNPRTCLGLIRQIWCMDCVRLKWRSYLKANKWPADWKVKTYANQGKLQIINTFTRTSTILDWLEHIHSQVHALSNLLLQDTSWFKLFSMDT